MADNSDDALLELVAQEQRDFRRLLFSGMFALVLVALVSVGTSFYLWRASTQITEKIDRFEFSHGIEQQDSLDRINRLQTEVRDLVGEFWNVQKAEKAGAAIAPEQALAAARAALAVGRLPLQKELMLDVAGGSEPAAAGAFPETSLAPSASSADLIAGVSSILGWLRFEETFPPGAFGGALPPALANARTRLEAAAADPAVGNDARTGLAWITFLDVQTRGAFTPDACAVLLAQTDALKKAPGIAPQALYWSAQCLRKSGRYFDSLNNYVALLDALANVGGGAREGARLLEMNAFHGLGTQLIATRARPDADIASALAIARARCGADASASRMAIARSCLDAAVALRKRLSQTQSDQAGTLENKNFAYLAERDFAGALTNAGAVADLRPPLAWNELARMLAAENAPAGEDPKANARIAREAAANLAYLDYNGFAVCELKVLLDADLFARAEKALADAFPKARRPNCADVPAAQAG
jgi:hypothetical protein